MVKGYSFHVFKINSENFLYLSGYKQLFKIDDQEFKTLKYDGNNKSNILNKYVELTNPIDRKPIKKIEPSRFGLFLCVANVCNASCEYCFAKQGDYGREKGIMTNDIAIKSIDFFINSVPVDSLANIIFFGGEPLLAFNVIVHACEYINSKYEKVRMISKRIVTNATLLTEEIIDYFKNNNFTVAISIDGGKEIQNRQRPLADGKDSFEEATKYLNYLLEKIPHTNARGTYVNFNYNLAKIYEELLDLGFKSIEVPPDILNFKDEKQMEMLLCQMDNLYEYILSYIKNHNDFPFDLFTATIRFIFLPKFINEYACGAGRNIISIDYKGNIFPCHRYTAEEKYQIGNINNNLDELKYLINKKNDCEYCWNKFICSHGCMYNDHIYKGSKNPFWCIYSKKMTELSLALCINMSKETLNNILTLDEVNYKQ